MKEVAVSVVIPTLNRENFLFNTVKDLLKQDYQNYEIIIVDQSDKPNEKILDLSKNNPKIKYFHILNFKGLPQARNFGWQHAKSEIIIFIDDDVKIPTNFIRKHIETYDIDDNIVLVGGGIDEQHRGLDDKEPVGKFNYWTATPLRGFANKKSRFVDHVPGGNFSVKKQILEKMGGIDEILNIGASLYEETEFSLRVKNNGYKIYFNADARLLHLAAEMGGCRVKNIDKYMYGLAHNRMIVITRYLKYYHKPFALLRLILLGISYSKHDKSWKPLISMIKGIKDGYKNAKKPVKCKNYISKANI